MDNNFSGVCNREGFGIFINRTNGKKYIGLEYGKFIIIISHEVIGHYLRNLINSNSGLNAYAPTPNESFINDEDNILVDTCGCVGQKFEVILFGKAVPKIIIGGNHYLFNIKNWSLSLEKFKEGFIKNNIVKKINVLKEELREIKKDTFVKELFKDIKYDNVGEKMESQSITTRKNNKVIINNSDFVSWNFKYEYSFIKYEMNLSNFIYQIYK